MRNSRKIVHIDEANESEWLYALLADIRADIARAPKPESVERIRERLFAEMDAPVRAAA